MVSEKAKLIYFCAAVLTDYIHLTSRAKFSRSAHDLPSEIDAYVGPVQPVNAVSSLASSGGINQRKLCGRYPSTEINACVAR